MRFGLTVFVTIGVLFAPLALALHNGVDTNASLTNGTVQSQPTTVRHPQKANASKRAQRRAEYALWMTGTFDSPFGLTILSPKGGTYDYDGGTLSVTRIAGATMEGIWHQDSVGECADGGYWGHYEFTFTRSGFTGTFGHCEGKLILGNWKGTRRIK